MQAPDLDGLDWNADELMIRGNGSLINDTNNIGLSSGICAANNASLLRREVPTRNAQMLSFYPSFNEEIFLLFDSY